MFEAILDMALGLIIGSVKSASHITTNEWTLISSLYNALGTLLTKKPVGTPVR